MTRRSSLISSRTAVISTLACGVAAAVVPAASASAATAAVTPLTTGQVVFVYHGASGAQIAVANPDGSQLRTITPSGAGLLATDTPARPKFSPDGKHLSFLVNGALYVADPDGSNAAKVVPLAPPAGTTVWFSSYQWSADSAWLYVGETTQSPGVPAPPPVLQVAQVHPDGTGLKGFGAAVPNADYFSVATQTGEIGFLGSGGYEIFNPVTKTSRHVPGISSNYASLSPDGKYVAYGATGPTQGEEDVRVQPTDGSAGWTALSWTYYNPFLPAWSPDESQISSETASNLGSGQGVRVAVRSSSGGGNTSALTPVPAVAATGTLFGTISEDASWVPLPAGTAVHPPTSTPAPGPGPVPPGTTPVTQLGGADRIETGVKVSRHRWASGTADAVVLATGGNFADALAGVPLAAKAHGPLLLIDGASPTVRADVAAEISRVLKPGGTVYILGGTSAVNGNVEADLAAHGDSVVKRFAGGNRYQTSVVIAEQGLGSPAHTIVATGNGFADALAAGPLATGPMADAAGAPAAIVLSNDATLDPQAAGYLAGKSGTNTATVGHQATSAVPTAAVQLWGNTRYDTDNMVADRFVGSAAGSQVGVADGTNYPDALTGGAYMASLAAPGPILLVDGKGHSVPTQAVVMLQSLKTRFGSGLTEGDMFGGTSVITPFMAAQIVSYLHGQLVAPTLF